MDAGLLVRLGDRVRAAEPTWPLYRKLVAAIEGEIATGRLGHGAPIPGERSLAETLGVSRVTVRKAIDGLVDAGMLRRRHGARTEVSARVEKVLAGLTSFSEDMRLRGLEPGHRWSFRGVVAPTPAESAALGIAAETPVWRLCRVRTADGRAVAREISTVPVRFLPATERIEGSLYRLLDRHDSMPIRALQRLRAAALTAEDQADLGCDRATPILEIERRCFRADGATVEYSRSRYRSDVYDFVVELKR